MCVTVVTGTVERPPAKKNTGINAPSLGALPKILAIMHRYLMSCATWTEVSQQGANLQFTSLT